MEVLDLPQPVAVRKPGRGNPASPIAEAVRCLVLLLGCFPAIQPLIAKGLPNTHDGVGHLFRLLDFDLAFRSGDFYPRLAPHLALDYGYATFTFYAPATLYLGEAFRFFGLGYIASLKSLFAVSLLFSALGMYLLGREIYGWRGGLVAALAYVYLPYHLLDVYTRADVGEALGLAWCPFVLWSLWRVVAVPRGSTIGVAGLLLAALVATHNLTALLVAPLLAVVLVVAPGVAPWRRLQASAAVVVLASLLSAFYWVPVLAQLRTIDTSALTSGFFDYHQRFIPLDLLVQPTWSYDFDYNPGSTALFNLGRAQAVLLVLAAVWVLLVRLTRRGLLVLCVVGIGLLVWLQQAGSVVVWDLFPFARFIQFPYRLSVDVTILGALLLGAFVAAPRNSGPAPGRPLGRQIVWLAGLILGSSAIGVLLVTSLWSIPRTRTAFEESQVSLPMLWRLEADRQLFAGSTQGDYLPAGIVGSFFDLAARRDELFGSTAGADPAGSLTILQSDPLSLVARVASPRAVTLTFDRFAYAAWQAAIDGQAAPVRAQAPLDLVQVAVPAGNHLLTLDASGGFADRFGLAVSIVGGLVLIGLAMRHLPRNSRPKGWLLWLAVSIALATGMAVALGSQVEPPRALAGGVDFGRAGVASVRLVGSSLNLASRTPDGAIDLTLFWEARNSPLPSCEVHLRLLDDTGTVVARRDKEPLFGLRPCSTWATNEIIRDEEQIRLPPAGAAQPWRLALSMTLGDQALVPVTSADLLSWHDPGAPPTEDMVGILLGSLPAGSGPPMRSMAELASPGSFAVGAILAGRSQLESTAIQVGTTELKPAEPNQVRAGGSAGPASSESSRLAPSVLPDDVLHLRLVWRALRDVSTDYSVFTHVTDSTGNLVAQDDAWPDRYNFPTSVWFPGDTRVDDYELKLTKAVPGIYQITVGMYERPSLNRLPVIGDPAGGGEIVLGRFKVSRPDQVFGELRSVEPQDDVFGGQIALAGHHVAATAPLSTSLVVDLAWRAIRRPTNDFTVFVHLLDQAGKLVGQQDGPPQAGRFPTSWWDPGDTIYDRISIPLPSGLAPGSYQLEVGLYRPDTGERLAVVDATGQRLADRVIFPGPTVR